MKNMTFTKTKLAASIALLMGASLSLPAVAQEATAEADEAVEIISVRGIKGSLIRSADLKRGSDGIVDGISAEELGKFPDTNLAESLGRITGVSVSRANGEGSQITVRGFGPEFNLVTLNGRQMTGTGFTRSFNFGNLSSEGVAALELYKTARANIPTGGLGATVNIVTAKPFQQPGEKFSLMLKGIHDSSNEVGENVTPEVAGIYSNTFEDERFGFSANFSYYNRDFQRQAANIQGWKAFTDATYDVRTQNTDGTFSTDAVRFIDDAPLPSGLTGAIDGRATDSEGNPLPIFTAINPETGAAVPTAAHFLPQDMNYSIQDTSQERLNAQFTGQLALHDNFIVTVDHTISNAVTGSNTLGWGIWNGSFGGSAANYELDQNGTAIYYESVGNDQSFTQNRFTSEVDSEATGLNIEWNVNDDITVEFDTHKSKTKTDNTLDSGLNSTGLMILGSNNFTSKYYDNRAGADIPVFAVNWRNGTDQVDPSDIGLNLGIFGRSPGESELTQTSVDVEWLVDSDYGLTTVEFGAQNTTQSLSGSSQTAQPAGFNFNSVIFPDGMFEQVDLTGFLDQFDFGGAGISPGYTYSFSFDEALSRTLNYYGTEGFPLLSNLAPQPVFVEEETTSLYVNTSWEFEFGDYILDVNAGLRYEETEVESPGQRRVVDRIVWNGGSEWRTEFANGGAFTVENFSGDYDVLLPMFDLRMDVTDDVVTRLSWGKSISRAAPGQLLGGESITGFPGKSSRFINSGNPSLLPYESTNLDVSVEWYYDEGSYAAVSLFWKDVENWIDDSQSSRIIPGVYDIFNGARWNAASADLIANGQDATDDNIYASIIASGQGVDGARVLPDPATDPLVEWTVNSPLNVEERSTNGLEFAIQHLLGDSGFGFGLNGTIVDGDVNYDPYTLATQPVLPGLSDSANAQFFYDKDGLSVKLTGTWRDEYLIGQGQSQGSSEAPPQFAKEYMQWDFSVNYRLNDNVTFFLDGINILNETEEVYGRFKEQFLSAAQYGPRYTLGVRISSL